MEVEQDPKSVFPRPIDSFQKVSEHQPAIQRVKGSTHVQETPGKYGSSLVVSIAQYPNGILLLASNQGKWLFNLPDPVQTSRSNLRKVFFGLPISSDTSRSLCVTNDESLVVLFHCFSKPSWANTEVSRVPHRHQV